MATISTKELSKRMESGQAAVFDVRGDVESTPANIITTRSMPIPSPPVGGIPYSSARR